jgi:rhodanese-related sulfurtransferase
MTAPSRIPDVSRDEVRARLHDRSMTLINVLPRETFEAAHIPGSINLPLSEVESRAPAEIPDRASDLVLYCGSPT